MLKLITLLVIISLSGCTEHQRFALKLNAQLDACAMKRMHETKISGEQGYLQAHHECHQIVNIDKGHALHLQRVDFATLDRKDELEKYEICWEFVKGIVIDNNYPDLRPPSRKERTHSLTDFEAHKELVARNSKVSVLPNTLDELTSKNLLMVRDTMQRDSVIGHDTLCSPWSYHELLTIIGKEIHHRYPHGVDSDLVENLK